MPLEKNREFLNDASSKMRAIVNYWDDLRGTRDLPLRVEFDPLHIPRHLPGILFIEVEGTDDQGIGIYRYRVVGNDEVENRKHNPTGKLVDEGFFYGSLEGAKAEYERVRRTKECHYISAEFVTEDYRLVRENAVLLPFGNERGAVSHILVFSERRDEPLP